MARLRDDTPARSVALLLAGFVAGKYLLRGAPLAHASPSAAPPAVPHSAKAQWSGEAGADAGADATHPGEIPLLGWWHVVRRAAAGFVEDRVMAEAAGVTFYVLLALFPAIASVISIYGLFADPHLLAAQLDDLTGLIPQGGMDIVKGQLDALTASPPQALGIGAASGLLISLWSANAGVKSFFDALNVVYHEHEKRSFVKLTLVSFAFTLGVIAFVMIAVSGVVVVPVVLGFVGFRDETARLVALTRWPLMLLIVATGLAVLYRFGPSRRQARWVWVSWGSALAALIWVGASFGFSYYVAHFGSYNKTYGSLGAAVGFMTWIWVSSIVVLLGAEVNAELEHQTRRDSTVGPEKPMGARGAYKADFKM